MFEKATNSPDVVAVEEFSSEGGQDLPPKEGAKRILEGKCKSDSPSTKKENFESHKRIPGNQKRQKKDSNT